ncbi:helix-turn-helix domain-containing protein, partial [Micromonospora foliorum]|uniref:helix-turn-helix domain-containing protein n=1 Tax=Micromonospora foliorum TaxID=2911210 RepID=UPI001EE97EE6
GGGDLRRAAEAARGVPAGDEPAGLFLTGLTAWTLDGYAAAVPHLRRALDTMTADENLHLLWLAGPVAHEVWDDAAWYRLTEQAVGFARTTGGLSLLPTALTFRAGALVFAGRFADASDLLDEADALAQATGMAPHPSASLTLAAHRGRELPAMELIDATIKDAEARGEGRLLGLAGYARAVLSNGLGQYPAALEAARQATEYEDLAVFNWTLGELVEAAVRVGDADVAAEARERLAQRVGASGTDWALGAGALADALAGPSGQAEDRYREAIERLAPGQLNLQLARARLLYGEWLRRENRRADARTQLRAAHGAFATMGAQAFAERASRELLATGETVRKRTVGVPVELTPQEAQIARLAVAGRTNPEIGAVLFLSPRTVEWHLRKVFTKLGIGSRRELAAALRDR